MNYFHPRSFEEIFEDVKVKIAAGLALTLAVFAAVSAALYLYAQGVDYLGVIFVAIEATLIGVAVLIFYLVRKRNEALAPVTQETLLEVIRREDENPRVDSDGWILFTVNGDQYIAKVDRECFYLHFKAELSDEHLDEVQNIADKLTREMVMVKLIVVEDDGKFLLFAHISAVCGNRGSFKSLFPVYFDILVTALMNFGKEYECLTPSADSLPSLLYDLYYPEFFWLPKSVFESVSKGEIAPEVLTDEVWLRKFVQNGMRSEAGARKWDSFKIVRVDNYGYCRLVAYQFPEPEVAMEAQYGVVVLNLKTLEVDYYTLGYVDGETWTYGRFVDGVHRTCLEVDTSDLEAFVEWVLSEGVQIEEHGSAKMSQEVVN